jgi:uncharacterized membrane protein
MMHINRNVCLVIAFAVVALLVVAAPAMAEAGYLTVYDGFASDGIPVQLDGCTVTATLSNNSTAAHITVRQMGNDDVTGTVDAGNFLDAGDFRVEVANGGIDHAGERVYLKILKFQASSSTPSGAGLSCSVPGQRALGGDEVTFPVTIQNYDSAGHTYTLSATSDTGWALSFESAGKDVYKLFVPGGQSVTVNFVVQTTGSAGIGEKRVTAMADSSAIDLYVYITSENQSASVSFDVGSKIASVGDTVTYNVKITNLQSKENTYQLSASGLLPNWGYSFKQSSISTEEMAEVVIPAGGSQNLVLEVRPPYSVSAGDYSLTATVTSPDGTAIDTPLNIRLKSSSDMTMTAGKLQYDAKPGQTFEIDVYVTNSGSGAALTNVHLEADAPDGWTVQVSPNRTSSLTAGSTQTFRAMVNPPGNIVPSDYSVTHKAVSDKAEKEKDYRITVKVDSIVPYIGGGIILAVIVGLVLMYRKYGRR